MSPASSNPEHRSDWAVISVLLLLCIIVFQTVPSIISQLNMLAVSNAMQFVRLGGESEQLETNVEAINAYRKSALFWQSKNADLWEVSGDSFANVLSDGLTDSAEERVNSYRKAIELEPVKAQYWMKLVVAKARKSEFDLEFNTAFRKSYRYGKSEYFINRSLLSIGLAYLDQMNVNTLILLKKITANLYRNNPFRTIILAQKYNQLNMVCIWARGIGKVHPLCKREHNQLLKKYSNKQDTQHNSAQALERKQRRLKRKLREENQAHNHK